MQAFIAVLVAIILLGGGWYWYSSMQTPAATPTSDMNMDTTPTNTNPSTDTSGGTQIGVDGSVNVSTGATKEITVTNAGLTFNPKTLSVKKGDRVKITFTNTGGTHNFRIDNYNVGTNVLNAGQSESFEFVADKAGTFEYFCSVGNHRAMGMKGTLTVTP